MCLFGKYIQIILLFEKIKFSLCLINIGQTLIYITHSEIMFVKSIVCDTNYLDNSNV